MNFNHMSITINTKTILSDQYWLFFYLDSKDKNTKKAFFDSIDINRKLFPRFFLLHLRSSLQYNEKINVLKKTHTQKKTLFSLVTELSHVFLHLPHFLELEKEKKAEEKNCARIIPVL